ncbi:hypothetical protein [Phreatobacter stygius]|uniref:Uncharacterized protein n=1 Tax=Phreatobacter stygius TaxID=1940610 RepID=A0A4D7BJ60_9HYPH|nr:hypothetical protein [Phreatobacter stygius]QCI67767.1 hypothetical protein E8M01_28215 [Phreatobacter stygius]
MGNPVPRHSPGFDEDDPARRRREPDVGDPVIDPERHPDQDPAIDQPADSIDEPPPDPPDDEDRDPR